MVWYVENAHFHVYHTSESTYALSGVWYAESEHFPHTIPRKVVTFNIPNVENPYTLYV